MVTRAFALIACLASVGIVTAQAPPVRARIPGTPVGAAALPTLTIDTPVQASTITVATSTITLGGLAQSTSASPLASVTWTCATCTPTSGTANLSPNGRFETAAQSSSLTIAQEGFASSSSINLVGTFADTTGEQWIEGHNTLGGSFVISRRTLGYIQPSNYTSGAAAHSIVNLLTPSQALSGTNYTASVKLVEWTSIGSDDGTAIVFGYQDSSNYCAAFWLGPSANPDLYLYKRTTAGGLVQLGTAADINTAANDVLLMDVNGSSLAIKQNDVSKVTAADAGCQAGTGIGVGYGAINGVATFDMTTAQKLDDFKVVDRGVGGSAVGLALGNNDVVFTATDGLGNSSVPFTVRVIREAADSVPPEVTITLPTTLPDQNTPTAAITIEGTCTDNTACTSVTLSCADCSPVVSSAACTLSGSGTSKTFVCPQATQTATTNELIVTAQDAQSNSDTDQLNSTYAASDVTAPVVTITTSGGTTSTNPLQVQGTAQDAVGVVTVSCTSDVGSCGQMSAPPGTNVSWSVPVNLVTGANEVCFTATDGSNNTTATPVCITVTLSATVISIVTTSLPNARVGTALDGSFCLNTANGSGVKAFSKDSGTYPGGVSFNTSTGCWTGTPTTVESQALGMRVTDDSGSDTQSLTFNVIAAGSEGPHDYFNLTLLTHPNCWKAWSFRPLTGQTTPVTNCGQSRWEKQLMLNNEGAVKSSRPDPRITYCPTGTEYSLTCLVADTDPQRQDAARLRIPLWQDPGSTAVTLASDINSSVTTIPLNGTVLVNGGGGAALKIDDEIMLFPAGGTQNTTANPVVERGSFFPGSNTSHTAGTRVYKSSNINPTHAHIALNIQSVTTETVTYIYTWDTYYTDSWIVNKHGLLVHKTFKFLTAADGAKDWFRADGAYAPEATDNVSLTFDRTRDAGFVRGRRFGTPHPPAIWNDDAHHPAQPIASGSSPIIKPNVWGRWWFQLDTKAEGVAANYTDMVGAVLVAAVTTAPAAGTEENITIACPGAVETASYGPECHAFTAPYIRSGGSGATAYPGRSIRIGSEIMTIKGPVSTTSSPTREITVVRGAYGTTPATHANGAQIQAITDDISLWYADENTDPVQVLDRWPAVLPESNPTVSQRGTIRFLLVEFSTSTDFLPLERITNGNQQDLVVYLRNFAAMKYSGIITSADWSSLRIKPVR
jgi:hypothetical protein